MPTPPAPPSPRSFPSPYPDPQHSSDSAGTPVPASVQISPEALAIQAALRDCYDPNLPCNILDLGFLTALAVVEDPEAPGANIPGVPPRFAVSITLTPALEDDTTEAHLRAQVLNRLAGLPTVSRTTLDFRYNPAWTPLRISPAGRRILGLDGNPNLVQIR